MRVACIIETRLRNVQRTACAAAITGYSKAALASDIPCILAAIISIDETFHGCRIVRGIICRSIGDSCRIFRFDCQRCLVDFRRSLLSYNIIIHAGILTICVIKCCRINKIRIRTRICCRTAILIICIVCTKAAGNFAQRIAVDQAISSICRLRDCCITIGLLYIGFHCNITAIDCKQSIARNRLIVTANYITFCIDTYPVDFLCTIFVAINISTGSCRVLIIASTGYRTGLRCDNLSNCVLFKRILISCEILYAIGD